jgi:hypothetical protein
MCECPAVMVVRATHKCQEPPRIDMGKADASCTPMITSSQVYCHRQYFITHTCLLVALLQLCWRLLVLGGAGRMETQ